MLPMTAPAYRALKSGLHTRVPGPDVLRDHHTLPVLVGLKGDDLLQGLGKPDSLFGGPGRDAPLWGAGETTSSAAAPGPIPATWDRGAAPTPPADWSPTPLDGRARTDVLTITP